MATRHLLADLARQFAHDCGVSWQIESVGGVDATRRVGAGEDFDLVLLARDAMDPLLQAGRLAAGSRIDWVSSAVVVAVPAGSDQPGIENEAQLRQAVAAAPSLGISTGPSGAYVEKLIRGWGLGELLAQRRIVPPPGTPVAQYLAQGRVALGFQQGSEMIGVEGIRVLGPLPDPVGHTTIFSAAWSPAVASDPLRRSQAELFLAFLLSGQALAFKLKHGMSALS